MAARAHMSTRNFTRRFRQTTGTSPAQWLLAQFPDLHMTIEAIVAKVMSAPAAPISALRPSVPASVTLASQRPPVPMSVQRGKPG